MPERVTARSALSHTCRSDTQPRHVSPGGIPTTPQRRPPTVASVGIMLDRDRAAPGHARQYATAALADLCVTSEATEAAVTIISELVTNAVKYGDAGPVRLLVNLRCGTLTLTVADDTPYTPLPDAALPAAWEQETGRGLALVAALSQRWGHRPVGTDPECGTAVWAELAGAVPASSGVTR